MLNGSPPPTFHKKVRKSRNSVEATTAATNPRSSESVTSSQFREKQLHARIVADLGDMMVDRELSILGSRLEEMSMLDHTLSELPKRLKHKVFVPVGNVAFMSGTIHSTNEVLVELGGDVCVWRSAYQAREILARRRVPLEQDLEQLKLYQGQIMNASAEGLGDLHESAGEDPDVFGEDKPVEIREPYDPDEQRPVVVSSRPPPPPVSKEEHERLLAKFEELARLEENEDEMGLEEGIEQARTIVESGSKQLVAPKTVPKQPVEPTKRSSGALGANEAFTGKIVECGLKDSLQPKVEAKPVKKKVSLFKQKLQKQ